MTAVNMRLSRHLWALWLPVLALLAALGAFVLPAHADALDQYRASGEVIERFDGLLEAAPSAPAAARALVKDINVRRQAVYAERAKQNGVPASEVGKVYAQQIFAKAPAGTKFRKPDGTIIRK